MAKPQSDLVLTLDYRIPTYFVSLNGQTKFYTLCNLLLESAARHAKLFQFGYDDMKRENIYWVLSRFQVSMRSYPKMDQPIKVKTWPKGINKLFFLRDFKILSDDGSVLADATTAWLILDLNTGRPKKISDAQPNIEDISGSYQNKIYGTIEIAKKGDDIFFNLNNSSHLL